MSLVNLAGQSTFGWADHNVRTLESQAERPLFSTAPVEMGIAGLEDEVSARLGADAARAALFARAFPGEPIDVAHAIAAIASFERTLVSRDSPFDRWIDRDVRPADAVVRGFRLFSGARLGCSRCHAGRDLRVEGYFVTGVPGDDPGLGEVTHAVRDLGAFKVPTLRNIEVTAPYMHSGEFATLDDVIDFYAAGPNPANGLGGFELSQRERSDLLAFLGALTDTGFLTNPALGPPPHE